MLRAVVRLTSSKLGLSEAHTLATLRGGRCLSDEYVNVRTLLTWQCEREHTWQAPLASIKYGPNGGSWCPHCALDKRRLGLQFAQRIAQSNGGVCLSSGYQNVMAKLKWQCSKGHVWHAALRHVHIGGTWCPECVRLQKSLSIEFAREVAESRGGRCLSSGYLNNKATLAWECKIGHRWKAPLKNVYNGGTWCPTCTSGRFQSEQNVRTIFETIFAGFNFASARPLFLRVGQRSYLQLDGYNEALNIAFEFHGMQHYRFVPFFHRTPEGYSAMLRRDQSKLDLCIVVGIRLIVVPCFVKDRWTFVRSWLLKWFLVSVVFPPAIPP